MSLTVNETEMESKKYFYQWWNNDKAMQKAISVFDIGMQGIIHNQTETGFKRGYEAVKQQVDYESQ
jgi:hypothetical protein